MTTLREAFGGDATRVIEAIRAEYLGVRSTSTEVDRWETTNDKRRVEMKARLQLYRDNFRAEITALIEQLYTHKDVKEERLRFIDLVGFLNVPKRITDEVASLYDVPAKRLFEDEAMTTRFAAVEREVQLHSVMKEAHRLCFWLNEGLLWQVDRNQKRSLRIVTPDSFTAIPSRHDALDWVATIIDTPPAWVPSYVPDRRRLTHYELWDSEMVVRLDADGLIVGTPQAHGLGRMPGVLMHSRLPTSTLMNSTL